MKIIYYSPHPTHDIVSEVGYSTHQRETINAMRALGHEVHLVIMGGTEKSAVDNYHTEITKESGLKKRIKKLIPSFIKNTIKDYLLIKHDTSAVHKLEKAILETQPDLVYERGEFMQNKGVLLCKKLGIRHFLEINSPCVEEMRIWEGPSLLHFLALKKEKSKINNTNQIFAVSSAIKKVLEEKYGYKKPIYIIPNCINPDRSIPNPNEISEFKTKLNIENKKIVGFVGSIFPYHGVDTLIKAFPKVYQQHPDTLMMIVGDGYLRKTYEALAATLLPKEAYVFTGKIPHTEINKYISLFDIAVMPDSNWYGSPIKIFEYGFLKKAIVAPNKAPLRDVIEHKIDGILSETDETSLAQNLVYAIEHEEEMKTMGLHFYDKIMQHYTWQKQAEFILSKVPD